MSNSGDINVFFEHSRMKQCKEALGLMNCELLLRESISGN